MYIVTVVATTNETEIPFTVEQLQKLADTAVGCPIYHNFNTDKSPAGYITKAKVSKDRLVVEANLLGDDLLESIPNNVSYLVPCFIIPEYKSYSYGLTYTPTDKTLETIIFNKGDLL